jgi:hypothetical protein
MTNGFPPLPLEWGIPPALDLGVEHVESAEFRGNSIAGNPVLWPWGGSTRLGVLHGCTTTAFCTGVVMAQHPPSTVKLQSK